MLCVELHGSQSLAQQATRQEKLSGARAETIGSVPFQKNRKNFGKELTRKQSNVFLETFPLKRKRFFEIYFVRLIGTPNQHIPRHRIHILCLEKQRKLLLFSSS